MSEAEDYLNEWISREPSNALPLWAMSTFQGKDYQLPDEKDVDENFRVLKHFTQKIHSESALLPIVH